MENIYLLTFIATLAIISLYYLDGKLSEKERTFGDHFKTCCMVATGIYLALINHSVAKQVLQEVVEVGPANF